MNPNEEKTVNQQVYEEIGDPTPQAAQNSSPENPAVEEPQTQTEAAPAQPAEQAEEPKKGQPQEQPQPENNRGAQPRIRELVTERNQEREHVASLKDQLGGFGLQDEWENPLQPQQQQPYQPQVQPGQEITPQQYQQDVFQVASTLVDLKLKARDNGNRIKSEISDALSDYPELNPGTRSKPNPNFDPDLSEGVTDSVKAFVRANPTGNVKKFIDKLIKPYQRAVAKEVGKQTETIAKQVSETALRPTQVRSDRKNPKDESLEEMERRIPKVYG